MADPATARETCMTTPWYVLMCANASHSHLRVTRGSRIELHQTASAAGAGLQSNWYDHSRLKRGERWLALVGLSPTGWATETSMV